MGGEGVEELLEITKRRFEADRKFYFSLGIIIESTPL